MAQQREKNKKVSIICGHYGSGKTNFAVNLAMHSAASGLKTAVCDFDVVNPYFRLADFENLFKENGIEAKFPVFANTGLDAPSLQIPVDSLLEECDHLIIDTGGDAEGATALGKHAIFLNNSGAELNVLYVVNKFRYLTDQEHEAFDEIFAIEAAQRIKITGIVNNSNLGTETKPEMIKEGFEFSQKLSEKSKKPLVCTTYPDFIDINKNINININIPNAFKIKVYVKKIWE